jgi:8-oxo-dGTP pyrophosphatase MutT (NUDIX family)
MESSRKRNKILLVDDEPDLTMTFKAILQRVDFAVDTYEDRIMMLGQSSNIRTLLMIEQYRYPLHKALLEFPAGHIENGENPKDTAIRELAEETGYHSKELTIQEEGVGRLKHESTEDIKIKKVKVKELAQMITDKEIENAGTLIAYLICCIRM